jgi:hypothetical protein
VLWADGGYGLLSDIADLSHVIINKTKVEENLRFINNYMAKVIYA